MPPKKESLLVFSNVCTKKLWKTAKTKNPKAVVICGFQAW
jgi:hypothetical protein